MNKLILTACVVLSVGGAITVPAHAAEKVLTQDQLKSLIPGSTARHWDLDHQRWYVFEWKGDGTFTVKAPGDDAGKKPIETGKWWVKEVKAEDGQDPEELRRMNAELDHLYCQQFDNWDGGHKLCYEFVQTSFNTVPGSEDEDKTQEYKVYREAGAETGAFTLTQD